jgi:hypothetical protein
MQNEVAVPLPLSLLLCFCFDVQEAIAHEYFEDIRTVASSSTGNLAALLRLHSSGDLQTMEVEAVAAAAGVTVGGGGCVGSGAGLQHQVSQVGGGPERHQNILWDFGTCAFLSFFMNLRLVDWCVDSSGDLQTMEVEAAGVSVRGGSCAGGGGCAGGLQHQVSQVRVGGGLITF